MIADLSVIGLGKLGGSILAAAAQRGFSVIGYDINPKALEAIEQGRGPVWETDLDAVISANKERISVAPDAATAVQNSRITYTIVPTPSLSDGSFSLEYAEAAFREIGKGLARKDDYHVVALNSTVLPGSMSSVLVPALEESSGKRCGPDFGVCYNPLFIALGSIIRDLTNPDLLLVGESDSRAGDIVSAFLSGFVVNGAVPQRMSFENAELSKISVNTFVTMKITFANMLAAACDRLPGGDVDAVSNAIGLDGRIGRKYLTGGLGYGGPCFPRDNLAMKSFADSIGVDVGLSTTTDTFNRSLPNTIVESLSPFIGGCEKVAVLGLSYKPQSNWAEESQGVLLANRIRDMGPSVCGFDPLANEMARELLSPNVDVAESMKDCVQGADMVLIATPDDAFNDLETGWFSGRNEQVVLVDFWRRFGHLADSSNIRYVAYGRASHDRSEE